MCWIRFSHPVGTHSSHCRARWLTLILALGLAAACRTPAEENPAALQALLDKGWSVLDSCEHPMAAGPGGRLFLCLAKIDQLEASKDKDFERKEPGVLFPNRVLSLLSIPYGGGPGVALWTRFEYLEHIAGGLDTLHGNVVTDGTGRRALVSVVRSARAQNKLVEVALHAVDLGGRSEKPVPNYDPREWEKWYKKPAPPLTSTQIEHRQFFGGVTAVWFVWHGIEATVVLRPRSHQPWALVCLRYNLEAKEWSPLLFPVWQREPNRENE